jgi:hypothetical protein
MSNPNPTYGEVATAEIVRYVNEARDARLTDDPGGWNRQLAVASFAKAYRFAVTLGVTREEIDYAIRHAGELPPASLCDAWDRWHA